MFPRLIFSAGAAALSAAPLFAAGSAAIDQELAGYVDFRAYDYAACLGQSECTVGKLTLHAERFDVDTSLWVDAPIYWDPVDGIGVQDGAQNDEIDFDERIIVSLTGSADLKSVWLSDLFHTEDRRYGSSGTDRVLDAPEDAEIAAISVALGDVLVGSYTTIAEDRLPWASFNQEVHPRFLERGDMRRRVVINDELSTLVVPDENRSMLLAREFELGNVDEEKKASLFEGLDTVQVDLTEILAEFHQAPLFASGTMNFQLIKEIAESSDAAAAMRKRAETKRVSINMSNGEIRWSLDAPVQADSITFLAPFDASNDFSVAGIVLENWRD